MQLDQQMWDEIMACARKCQRTWGMGFPVISMPLLRDILEGRKPDEPPKYPKEYLATGNPDRGAAEVSENLPPGYVHPPDELDMMDDAELRDALQHWYLQADKARKYLAELTPGIGTGDDPVGTLVASHAALSHDLNEARCRLEAAALKANDMIDQLTASNLELQRRLDSVLDDNRGVADLHASALKACEHLAAKLGAITKLVEAYYNHDQAGTGETLYAIKKIVVEKPATNFELKNLDGAVERQTE